MLSILQVHIGHAEVVRAEHVAVVRECALVGVVALFEETLLLLCKSKAVQGEAQPSSRGKSISREVRIVIDVERSHAVDRIRATEPTSLTSCPVGQRF